MKTKEELIALKAEYESINKKLSELTDDEMEQVTGGFIPPYPPSSFGGSKEEYTIPVPEGGDNMWRSWNPGADIIRDVKAEKLIPEEERLP